MANQNWTGKSKGSKAGYQVFVYLLNRGGVRAAYLLLYFVAFYYLITSRTSSRAVYRYFRKLGYSGSKSMISVYRNYFAFGQSMIDRIAILSGTEQFDFVFEGESNLKQMVEEGRGGIMLSAHIGNWEIAGSTLGRLNSAVSIVMYDAEYRKIKEYMERVTGKRKMKIITISDDNSHVYQIMEALSNNELVCIHADRMLPGAQRFIEHPFLNTSARFPYSIFRLAVIMKVPVSLVFAFRERGKAYHLFASAPKYYSPEKDESITELLSDYVTELEDKIHMYPLQWFNYYDFWKP